MPSAKNIDEIYWPSVRIRWYVEKWAELGVTKPPGRILRDVGFKFLAALSGLTVEQVHAMNPITYATTYFHVDQNTAERKYAGESYGQLEWKAGYARSRNEQPPAEPAAAAAAPCLRPCRGCCSCPHARPAARLLPHPAWQHLRLCGRQWQRQDHSRAPAAAHG